jgi:hypothetical protein
MIIRFLIILNFVFFFTSCKRKFSFEIDNTLQAHIIKLDYNEIGDAYRLKRKYIWFWNDTIIIDGIKNGPTKDTVKYEETVKYYGLDTLIKFEKYKATDWYIKQVYEFYY